MDAIDLNLQRIRNALEQRRLVSGKGAPGVPTPVPIEVPIEIVVAPSPYRQAGASSPQGSIWHQIGRLFRAKGEPPTT